MKRFLCLLLTLVVLFGLVACAGSEPETSTDTATATGRYPNDGLYTDGLPEVDLSTDTSPVSSVEPPVSTVTSTVPVSTDSGVTDSVTDTPTTDSVTSTRTNEKITIGTVSVPKTSTKTNTGSGNDTNDTKVTLDTSTEHKFFATDIKNHSIVIFDLNKCNGDLANLTNGNTCVVWEWDADNDSNCKYKSKVGKGIDAAKLRYSSYYKKDVVIACSSIGWAGIIDYNAKTVLWETTSGVGGAHSVELLPNGDLVVITSTAKTVNGESVLDGKLMYFGVTAGATTHCSEITTPSGHGVMWDPQNQRLWVLEYEQVFGCKVSGSGKSGKLTKDNTGYDFTGKDISGHVLMPVLGEPGKYWVAGGDLWKFDAETEEMVRSATYQSKWMKGVASFADGVMVQSVPAREAEKEYLTTGEWDEEQQKYTGYWSTTGFRIWTMEPAVGLVTTYRPMATDIYFADREFYKVYPVYKDYQ